jgi:hypothetical protein
MDHTVQTQEPVSDRKPALSTEANTNLTVAAGGGAVGAVAGVMTGVSVGAASVGAAVAFPMVGLLVGALAAGGLAQLMNHSHKDGNQ